MFMHSFKHSLKTMLRKKELVFWSLIFPIVLALFFKLALGGISNINKFEKVPVSVDEKLYEDKFFVEFLNGLEEDGYFKVTKTDSQDLLLEEKVLAHIEAKDKVVTRSVGIKETMVETIINTYLQTESTITNIFNENPQADINEILKINDYIEDKSNPNMDSLNTYFYTLVGMQAMYGYMWGMVVMYQYEANLSTEAKRNLVSPIKKSTSLFASLLVAWIINLVIVLVTMAFCKYALGIDYGDKFGLILLIVSLGALTGVAFGAIIAVSNKKGLDFKIGLGIGITMLFSFLAGMMMDQMKVIVQKNAPIINKINPVALITDGIYSIYYYGSLDRFFNNIYWLLGITIALLLVAFSMIRRKKYDSL